MVDCLDNNEASIEGFFEHPAPYIEGYSDFYVGIIPRLFGIPAKLIFNPTINLFLRYGRHYAIHPLGTGRKPQGYAVADDVVKRFFRLFSTIINFKDGIELSRGSYVFRYDPI